MTRIEASLGAQPGREPINWCAPGSPKCFSFIKDYIYIAPLPACAKDNPPCPIMPPQPFVFKAGDRIEGKMETGMLIADGMAGGMQIPAAVLQAAMPTPYTQPIIYIQKPSFDTGAGTGQAGRGAGAEKIEEKDPWTGKPEWDRIFSPTNFWRLVIVLFFIFLFLKYMLPLIKKSFAKS